MSFNKHKTIIEEGDTVVIYLTINNIHAIEVYEKIKNKKGELVEYIFQVFNFVKIPFDSMGTTCLYHSIFLLDIIRCTKSEKFNRS
jgi:hypothetical protein